MDLKCPRKRVNSVLVGQAVCDERQHLGLPGREPRGSAGPVSFRADARLMFSGR